MSVRRGWTALVATVLGLALAGCAGPVDLRREAADDLRAGVRQVTEDVVAGRLDAADAGLEALRVRLEAAAQDGAVGAARYSRIDAALERTAAEVVALRRAADRPTVDG